MDTGYHSHGACVPLVDKHHMHSEEGWAVILSLNFKKNHLLGLPWWPSG